MPKRANSVQTVAYPMLVQGCLFNFGGSAHMKRMSFMLALLLAIAAPAFAQIQGGSISGTVKDEQGGVLPGVTVTAQGLDATQTFVTEGGGEYRFLNLAPGPYKVTATLQGFATVCL